MILLVKNVVFGADLLQIGAIGKAGDAKSQELEEKPTEGATLWVLLE